MGFRGMEAGRPCVLCSVHPSSSSVLDSLIRTHAHIQLFTDAAAILARKDGEAAASYDDRLCALLRAMDGLLDSQPAVKRLGGSCAFLGACALVQH